MDNEIKWHLRLPSSSLYLRKDLSEKFSLESLVLNEIKKKSEKENVKFARLRSKMKNKKKTNR
jgi:hypothetical protein